MHHYTTDEITITTDDRVATLTNEPTSRPEVQSDAGQERTGALTKVSMPETTAGRDTRKVAAKGTAECQAHMPQAAEPHVTVEKKDEPSPHSPQQTRQPDGPQEMMPDGDMTKRHEDTTDDHQATADAQTATPRPGATETDSGHTPTCHQPTTRG